MNFTDNETRASLVVHRERLSAAKTFEDYKAAHIAYVDFLLEIYRVKQEGGDVLLRWIEGINPDKE